MALKLVFRKIWHKWPETLLLSPRGFDLTFWLKQQKLQTCVKQRAFSLPIWILVKGSITKKCKDEHCEEVTLSTIASFHFQLQLLIDFHIYRTQLCYFLYLFVMNFSLSLTFLEYILIFLKWFPAFCWHLCIILTHKICLTFNFMEFLFTLF